MEESIKSRRAVSNLLLFLCRILRYRNIYAGIEFGYERDGVTYWFCDDGSTAIIDETLMSNDLRIFWTKARSNFSK